MRLWLFAAGIDGAALVMLGAYGAHGPGFDPDSRRLFDGAWQYQALHAVALLALALRTTQLGGFAHWLLNVAALLFVLGTILFSGTLYAIAFGEQAPFSAAAPAGGIAFILGWIAVALAGLLAWRR